MTTSCGSTSSSRSSSSSTCGLIVSTTSSRTGGPNRRRASSRSSACSRSSSRSSSTSRSALRVTRKAWHSATSMPVNSSDRCAAMRSSIGRKVIDSSSGSSGGDPDQARDVVGHLDPGEPLGAALGVADGHGQVQREAGDVGERVRRVDRQRRQHREHGLGEVGRQRRALAVGQRRPPVDPDALLVQLRAHLVEEDLRVRDGQRLRPRGDAGQLLARGEPVRAAHLQAGLVAALQPGDADHVELVEVAREDRQELGPLQQRLAGVLGQREHAGVEVEPRQLAVEVAVVGQAGVTWVTVRGGRRRRARRRPGTTGAVGVDRPVGPQRLGDAGCRLAGAARGGRRGRARSTRGRRPGARRGRLPGALPGRWTRDGAVPRASSSTDRLSPTDRCLAPWCRSTSGELPVLGAGTRRRGH